MKFQTLIPFLILSLHAGAQTNYALALNGTNQYISIGTPLSNNTSYTKEAWIYVTTAASSRNIVSSANAPFWINAGQLSAGHGGNYSQVVDPSIITLNKWTHVAVTYNSATTTMRLYRDGTLVATNTSVASNYSSEATYIGSHAGASSFLQGTVDEVRIWNVARTQAQLKQNLLYPPANNASGLVAYYKLNDATGSNATNSTGGTNGTLQNAPSWQLGPARYAAAGLNFDGTDDVVNIADNNSLDITAAITLEAWVYATKNTGIQNVVAKSSQAINNGYIFPRTDNGWTNTVMYLHIGGSWRTLSAAYPSLNIWHHLAATYDGSMMRIFIDGVQAATAAQSGAIIANTNILAIGNQPGYSEFFGGTVDEVRIWNVARSQAQIAGNMNVSLDPSANANLVSYYTFNQGLPSGANAGMTTLVDMKNENNGTLNNFAMSGATSNFIVQNAVLPLQWLSFTAEKFDKSVRLKWSTANEHNTKEFTVEHSINGLQWKGVATIAAAGNSDAVRNYFYLYANTADGLNYFRIKQTDIDGRSSFSEIRTVTIGAGLHSFSVLNNPANGGIVSIKVEKPSELSFYNSEGRLLWRRKFAAGNFPIHVNTYAKGVYFLRDQKTVEKVIVR
ncbi:MAG: T9SS type A sorting domain-containing protein [Chitinophagaceae bacterium]|nr:T9SS type A sorting domain-containing protein [Chitinophagaceae bacterium]